MPTAHAAVLGVHGALHPRAAIASARAAIELIVREELHAAPSTSLNKAIGTGRRFEVVRVPLGDVKAIKEPWGAPSTTSS